MTTIALPLNLIGIMDVSVRVPQRSRTAPADSLLATAAGSTRTDYTRV